MNKGYDITSDDVIEWAANYASYEELEKTAKAVYGYYVDARKKLHPKKHREARQQFKRIGKQKHKKIKQ